MSLAVGLVRCAVSLERTLTHDALTDDEGWLALHSLCLVESGTNLSSVVTYDLNDFPTECTILSSSVLSHHFLRLSRKLDVVGVVEHDEVVETENGSDTSSALRNLFLNATIRDVSVDGLLSESWVASVSSQELGCDGSTNSEHVTLTERTRCVLNATSNLELWVTRSRRTPLTELCQLFERELANEAELRVEHWSHVTWVEEETVATNPLRVLWVVFQILRIQNVDEIGTAHCTTWVTRLSLFYCTGCQDTDVVGSMIQNLN